MKLVLSNDIVELVGVEVDEVFREHRVARHEKNGSLCWTHVHDITKL